ncbi:hypothetical protein [Secundilactobacillus kimchicus]|uniref:hypothetical protein n=1 Tax=Secundilactobacillus kimchicus TaxID=528209 RepID=UPI0024A9DFFB|nr:hypothetical protein [Secundilactobacillus kimchicus]
MNRIKTSGLSRTTGSLLGDQLSPVDRFLQLNSKRAKDIDSLLNSNDPFSRYDKMISRHGNAWEKNIYGLRNPPAGLVARKQFEKNISPLLDQQITKLSSLIGSIGQVPSDRQFKTLRGFDSLYRQKQKGQENSDNYQGHPLEFGTDPINQIHKNSNPYPQNKGNIKNISWDAAIAEAEADATNSHNFPYETNSNGLGQLKNEMWDSSKYFPEQYKPLQFSIWSIISCILVAYSDSKEAVEIITTLVNAIKEIWDTFN